MLKRKLEEGNDRESPKNAKYELMGADVQNSNTAESDPLQIMKTDTNARASSPLKKEEPSGSQISSSKKKLTFDECLNLMILECEWNECADTLKKMEMLCVHIDEHLASVSKSSGDGFVCLWRECNFFCDSKDELDRHVYFHAFHTKLKAIGTVLMKQNSSSCVLDSSGRNMIPEIPERFQCMWVECDCKFNSAQLFYWHVQNHVLCVDPNDKKQFVCDWQGCCSTFKKYLRLADHTRSHTQEKRVGCPNCGGIYSSNTKFFDHLSRQIPLNMQQYQCSHCSTKFANERLLRDHVRRHVNHFKCTECEMTCTTKAVLLTHIRYRHSDMRPHSCVHCGKSFKTITDLNRHVTVHSEESPYVCPFLGCDYGCRAVTTLNKHIKMIHDGLCKEPYACHMCENKYSLGIFLTRHLIDVHSYHWPPGHSRFRYKQEEDGFYRLQTIRYESIELTQEGDENLQEEEVDSPEPLTSPSLPPPSDSVSSSGHQPLSQRDSNQDWQNSKMHPKLENVLLKTPSSPNVTVTDELLMPADY